nr:uncharacterized protein LOC109742154 [Aegilops tauschii subsp. strangulata]
MSASSTSSLPVPADWLLPLMAYPLCGDEVVRRKEWESVTLYAVPSIRRRPNSSNIFLVYILLAWRSIASFHRAHGQTEAPCIARQKHASGLRGGMYDFSMWSAHHANEF